MITLPYLVDRIEELPSLIARASFESEDCRTQYERSVVDFDMLKAKKSLTVKANVLGATVADIKATVEQDSDVYKGRMFCIEKESSFKRKEIERVKFDNEFTGLKLIARIKMSELKSIGGGDLN